MERMWKSVEQRGLVFADFGRRPGEKQCVIVGYARNPIEIEKISDRSRKGQEDEIQNLKCIRLEKAKTFALDPVLAAIRPQLTFCRWHQGAGRVRTLYADEPPRRKVTSLTPGQLEVLCFEYLRKRMDPFHLLLPIGRSLPDIDVYGWSGSEGRVAAQVTHVGASRGKVVKKAHVLREVDADQRFLFAGREPLQEARERDELPENVQDVAVEEVFDAMERTLSGLIDRMVDPG